MLDRKVISRCLAWKNPKKVHGGQCPVLDHLHGVSRAEEVVVRIVLPFHKLLRIYVPSEIRRIEAKWRPTLEPFGFRLNIQVA